MRLCHFLREHFFLWAITTIPSVRSKFPIKISSLQLYACHKRTQTWNRKPNEVAPVKWTILTELGCCRKCWPKIFGFLLKFIVRYLLVAGRCVSPHNGCKRQRRRRADERMCDTGRDVCQSLNADFSCCSLGIVWRLLQIVFHPLLVFPLQILSILFHYFCIFASPCFRCSND